MSAMNPNKGRKLSKFKTNVGCWFYGPKALFPGIPGANVSVPPTISAQGLVRAGFSGTYLNYKIGQQGKDMIVKIGDKAFLGKKVRLEDFNSLDFVSRSFKEGVILCEHISRNAETGQ